MFKQERRRFFRLDDSLKLSYRMLTAEEIADQFEGEVPKSPIAALFGYDKRIEELVAHYRHHSPEMGEMLGLLNKKINSVIDLLAVESGILHRVAYSIHQVNVSACGIAFVSQEHFKVGSLLGLDMLLSPEEQHLSVLGKVIACEQLPCENGSGEDVKKKTYFMRVDYEKIRDIDQEVLIQHLVKRQLVIYRRDKNRDVADVE